MKVKQSSKLSWENNDRSSEWPPTLNVDNSHRFCSDRERGDA